MTIALLVSTSGIKPRSKEKQASAPPITRSLHRPLKFRYRHTYENQSIIFQLQSEYGLQEVVKKALDNSIRKPKSLMASLNFVRPTRQSARSHPRSSNPRFSCPPSTGWESAPSRTARSPRPASERTSRTGSTKKMFKALAACFGLQFLGAKGLDASNPSWIFNIVLFYSHRDTSLYKTAALSIQCLFNVVQLGTIRHKQNVR